MKAPARPKISVNSITRTTAIYFGQRYHQQRMRDSLAPLNSSDVSKNCTDYQNKTVLHGERFSSTEDPCSTCMCISGFPNLCISFLCLQPKECGELRPIDGKCCEFECLDDSHVGNYTISGVIDDLTRFDPLNTQNLGLRLMASTLASFLILGLLLLLIHRLRQRRLISILRGLQAHRLESQIVCINSPSSPQLLHRQARHGHSSVHHLDQTPYQSDHLGDDQFDMPLPPPSYFGGREHDIPPWKLDLDSPDRDFMCVRSSPSQSIESSYPRVADLPPSYEQIFREESEAGHIISNEAPILQPAGTVPMYSDRCSSEHVNDPSPARIQPDEMSLGDRRASTTDQRARLNP